MLSLPVSASWFFWFVCFLRQSLLLNQINVGTQQTLVTLLFLPAKAGVTGMAMPSEQLLQSECDLSSGPSACVAGTFTHCVISLAPNFLPSSLTTNHPSSVT